MPERRPSCKPQPIQPLMVEAKHSTMCRLHLQPLALTLSTNPTPSTACRSRHLLLLACAKWLSLADQTITGTLTVAGASAARRIFLRSSAVGTTRTLTVGTLSADDCDFRDITIAGTAAGGSPTRAGDCGGNSGVTFPAPKTVYWNLTGNQNWSATAWATTSGGTPALDNFPLAQDTAVFDDTGAAVYVGMQTLNVGSVDMSARTSAMTMGFGTPTVYGNWTWGTGVTSSNNANTTFSGRGTSTITSNGVPFTGGITINCGAGTVQLADALEIASTRALTLTSGTFDAVSYNVTAGVFLSTSNVPTGSIKSLKMGSGLWTISGTGTVWGLDQSTFSTGVFDKGTADILLSSTSTAARTFNALSVSSYNKLTIGGTTGTSTLTINATSGAQFTELASTKTVAHTIALGTSTLTLGKWSVTGTSGNVVTLTGTGTNHQLAGACTDGIDYLAMGSIGFAATSPAEFYAGANSTGTAAVPVYRTAKPADSTRYWVGGTGNWNDTTYWSTSSGGAGGADLPRSHDDVVFDSLSNATAYTATVNAITGGNRCKALTIAGPASGDVTLAGSTALFIHDDITLPATGLSRTYSGTISLTGTGAGKTITTNGISLASDLVVNGSGCEWSLGSALTTGAGKNLQLTSGKLDTAGYNFSGARIYVGGTVGRELSLGSSTITCLTIGYTVVSPFNFTFDAGTSTILQTSAASSFSGAGLTYYNLTIDHAPSTHTFSGSNTFNNLTVAGRTTAGVSFVTLSADQTINGTLTLSAGTNATMRTFVLSNTIGTTRTLTCAAVAALTDIDFRDITIAGAAAPVSGTRLGDGIGNSGITFDAAKTVYWANANGLAWGNGAGTQGWSDTNGGATSAIYFPLAQDTAIIPSGAPTSGQTVTINAAYNIGTIDMSARTTNTMTLACSSSSSIYGNWTNGTGVTLSGGVTLIFSGRGSQTVTSAGRTFPQSFYIYAVGGSVTLQDALTSTATGSQDIFLQHGTFNANGYNVTMNGGISAASLFVRTMAFGSGTWTTSRAGTSAFNVGISSLDLTVTGTGTFSLTSASAKTFAGGGISCSGITLNQGGAGTLTITGNNTFANITNTYSATGATIISLGASTQNVADFTATGTAGNVLTIQCPATNPCNLIHTGAGDIVLDYLNLIGVRAYQI
jgi:hypothetical protein